MKKLIKLPLVFMLIFSTISLQQKGKELMSKQLLEVATLGGGCFWCVEAVFERVEGVVDVVSGYAGGHKKDPTYNDITKGNTGHAEVCQISFNPSEISFEGILEIFWQAHDPTTLNRQGNDSGTQYRSAIYFHDKKQEEVAVSSMKKASKNFKDPLTTELKALDKFYLAEVYHQDYFENNPNVPYCTFVIAPKLNKLKKKGTIWNE
jgi:peptide-methionine (S)-S-oxide reductase